MITVLTKHSLLLASITLFGACASEESFHTAREINEECHMEMQAARTAVRLRDKGKPKSTLQSQLPPIKPESSRLLINLHDIVTETFQYTTFNEVVYPTYRFELCLRQLQNKPYPISLAVIEQPLLHCQQQYGLQSSKQSTECIQHAMDHLRQEHLVNPIVNSVRK
jgi:hypothetical protein